MPKYNDFELDLQKQTNPIQEASLSTRTCGETLKYMSCCHPCDNTRY